MFNLDFALGFARSLDDSELLYMNMSRLIKDESENQIEQFALDVIKAIKLRTLMGYDMDWKKFVPYSDKYILIKGSTHVNLRLSFSMLSSMRYKRTDEGKGIIAFSGNNRRKAIYNDFLAFIHHCGIGFMPRRAFFGWNTKGDTHQAFLNFHISQLLTRVLNLQNRR